MSVKNCCQRPCCDIESRSRLIAQLRRGISMERTLIFVLPRSKVKELWDEYRFSRQLSFGEWWLLLEPEPPGWFLRFELEMFSVDGKQK